ncbi:phenolphthiocerol synthesis polyketide synthase type I Pks15/1 domain protein [Mycobacterium avium subsp. avium 2285 (R)]|nr:phenolphthiocerol synthesis polyketide synthase type I Pks15/1 domain protein [Mycobacterium avium subsp. avium 2285 (R)]
MTEVGAGVTDVAVGDAVMGIFGLVGSEAAVDRRLVTRVPPGWSMAQAAGIPVVFLTAYYGLSVLAGLRAGQRVLVHAATGGWAWPPCSWPGIGVRRCSPRPVAASGTRCAPWVSTMRTSRIPGPWISSRSSVPPRRHGRGAQLAGRRVQRCVVAAAGPRRAVHRNG